MLALGDKCTTLPHKCAREKRKERKRRGPHRYRQEEENRIVTEILSSELEPPVRGSLRGEAKRTKLYPSAEEEHNENVDASASISSSGPVATSKG